MPPDDMRVYGADDVAIEERPPPVFAAPVPEATRTEGSRPLKILMLEDQPNDVELIRRELRKAGLDFTASRVDTRDAFIAALETFAPDIVLVDYKLPGFNGAEALAHVRHVHPEIPVVMVTGVLGDEGAIELLKAGAKDYVLKDNLARLAPPSSGRSPRNRASAPARPPSRRCARRNSSIVGCSKPPGMAS